MKQSFFSEVTSWKQVFSQHLWKHILQAFILLGLSVAFFLSLWAYQQVTIQYQQFTRSGDVIVELDPSISEESQQSIIGDLTERFPGSSVNYWSPKDSEQFINRYLIPGYSDFSAKHQLVLDIIPLLQIRLGNFAQRSALIQYITQEYTQLLFVVEKDVVSDSTEVSSLGVIVRALEKLQISLVFLSIAILLSLIVLWAFFSLDFISKRTQGFSVWKFAGFSTPFWVLPALMVLTLRSVCIVFLSVLLSVILLGAWLWGLAFLYWVLWVLLDAVLLQFMSKKSY